MARVLVGPETEISPGPMPSAAAPMVELRGVTRRFEGKRTVYAVRDVSLRVRAGERVALMGPSGSGKSTLLNIVGGLDSPTEGSVMVGGVDTTRLDDEGRTRLRREKIGFVFQFFNLFPTLSAGENVAFPLHLAGASRGTARARAAEALETVGLRDRQEHLPDELSGGEQQRVAVARALITNPPLILADEPTGNLDSRNGAEILDLLSSLSHRFGTTIILVTHDAKAAETCDRIVHMRDGRVLAAEREDAPPHSADQPS
jgi:putative ABC transport system ATP-binding protein